MVDLIHEEIHFQLKTQLYHSIYQGLDKGKEVYNKLKIKNVFPTLSRFGTLPALKNLNFS